jgi:trk system potassium uptake protein TrkH
VITRFFPVLSVFSRVVVAFAMTFLVPLAWAWFLDHHDYVLVWAVGFGVTLISGAVLWRLTQRHRRELLAKDGFVLVNLVWIVLPAYAAVPLMFTVPDITWTKAYFEAMSALTATGSTALSGLDGLPVSVNVWRCFLQLIGGLGIMLLVVAVLPLLGLVVAQSMAPIVALAAVLLEAVVLL